MFDGVNPNGTWHLFVADLSTGGLTQVDEWSLTLEGIAVPESGWSIGLLVVGLVALAGFRVGSRRGR